MKLAFILSLSLVLVVVLFILWAAYPWSLSQKSFDGEIKTLEAVLETERDLARLKVMTWNLGFAHGEGSEGKGYIPKTREQYEETLFMMAEKISAHDVDVLFLQEVDLQSHRSHFIDQVEFLASKAQFRYLAYAPTWELNYLPFPYTPISHHFGKMKSGGAILSKFPILSNQVTLFEKPSKQPWWYNWFYLHRFMQLVKIKVGERVIPILNLHLEAFDKEDRQKQATLVHQFAQDNHVQVLAGDFNTVPPPAQKKDKFSDSEDDYTLDRTYNIIAEKFSEAIPLEIYKQNEKDFWTFPSKNPNRRLDYIFNDQDIKLMKGMVLLEMGELSDHLPFLAVFQLSGPQFNPYSQ